MARSTGAAARGASQTMAACGASVRCSLRSPIVRASVRFGHSLLRATARVDESWPPLRATTTRPVDGRQSETAVSSRSSNSGSRSSTRAARSAGCFAIGPSRSSGEPFVPHRLADRQDVARMHREGITRDGSRR
jgi:hypothetical protein